MPRRPIFNYALCAVLCMFSVFGHHVFASLKRGIFRSFLCAHIFTSLCRSGETGVVGYVPMYPKIDFLQNFCAVLYMQYCSSSPFYVYCVYS